MQFWPSIEPITFPTPSRYAMYYATDAGSGRGKVIRCLTLNLLKEPLPKTEKYLLRFVDKRNPES